MAARAAVERRRWRSAPDLERGEEARRGRGEERSEWGGGRGDGRAPFLSPRRVGAVGGVAVSTNDRRANGDHGDDDTGRREKGEVGWADLGCR
jgi:hypothetical protein